MNTEHKPIIEACLTARVEIIKDPADKDKQKTLEIKVPCLKIETENELQYCVAYADPSVIWRARPCPFSRKLTSTKQEFKLNPLKASKRALGK
jgi:hypothetical protein